jgi:hypothetical protein
MQYNVTPEEKYEESFNEFKNLMEEALEKAIKDFKEESRVVGKWHGLTDEDVESLLSEAIREVLK